MATTNTVCTALRRTLARKTPQPPALRQTTRRRGLATVSPVTTTSRTHKVVVVGGGTAGLSIAHQLLRTGRFSQDDLAVVDPATWHHYQPGWTLVGAGLKSREELRHDLAGLVDPKLKFYNEGVAALSPETNSVSLAGGSQLSYEQLVVVPGIKINYDAIKGLPEALADPAAPVSTIYGYDTVAKVFQNVEKFQKGQALFTQPSGPIKCAGAPQKTMWLSLDYWRRAGLYKPTAPENSDVRIAFATALPVMFGVPKYSARLDQLRRERGVEGLFQHDLVAIEGNTAVFSVAAAPGADGKGGPTEVRRHFDFLHATPKMGPHDFVRHSALADAAGFVDVDNGTTRSKKFPNVWSAGDASSLPTSKTAAAVTAQAPVLVANLLGALEGKDAGAVYDGYTSCPLLTEYGKVLLAEFKYGGEPKETFNAWFGIDQVEPRRAFYHLKKDFLPWVYSNYMVKGTWAGPNGWLR